MLVDENSPDSAILDARYVLQFGPPPPARADPDDRQASVDGINLALRLADCRAGGVRLFALTLDRSGPQSPARRGSPRFTLPASAARRSARIPSRWIPLPVGRFDRAIYLTRWIAPRLSPPLRAAHEALPALDLIGSLPWRPVSI